GQDARIVGRVDDYRDATGFGAVVLGSGAQHGGAADVDVLDRVLEGAVGFRDGFTEGVQVDHQHVDAVDAVFLQGAHVLVAVAAGQQAAVNLRVQRFYAAVENFRRAGVFGHLGDIEPRVAKLAGGAAGG